MTCPKQSLCFVPSAFRAVANLTWILADSDFTVCSSVCSAGSICNFIFWLWIYVTWHSAPVHFWENSVEKLCELFSNSVQMLQVFWGCFFCMCRWRGLGRSVVLSKSSIWGAFYKGTTGNFHLVPIQLLQFSPAVEWQLHLCLMAMTCHVPLMSFFFCTFFLFLYADPATVSYITPKYDFE